jgi:hypothetical protein
MYIVKAPNTTSPPRIISGRALAHRKLDARQKAAIAAEILNGEAAIRLTARQLATLLGVNLSYVAIAAQLTPGKREAIAKGKDETSFALLKRAMQLNAIPKLASAG